MRTFSMRLPLLLVLALLSCHIGSAQIGGKAGAFARMGFGARGMGMGNALTAVTDGDIVGYYNPATLAFSSGRTVSASFGILSLDRRLNFLHYSQPLPPTAGISFGIINAGVSEIDGRDADGEPTGPLQTSENQVFLAFANRFNGGFSLGINVKYYYHRLYTDVSTSSVGLDFGALVPLSDALTVGASVRDVNAQYRWDTSTLYGQSGNTTRDRFPLLYTAGASYRLPDSLGLVTIDLEASNQNTLTLRMGAEVPIIPELSLRAGMDRIDLKEKGNGVRPSFGFSIRRSFDTWVPALQYAYIHEPFASTGMHVLSLSVAL
jgi:hypothetical protein